MSRGLRWHAGNRDESHIQPAPPRARRSSGVPRGDAHSAARVPRGATVRACRRSFDEEAAEAYATGGVAAIARRAAVAIVDLVCTAWRERRRRAPFVAAFTGGVRRALRVALRALGRTPGLFRRRCRYGRARRGCWHIPGLGGPCRHFGDPARHRRAAPRAHRRLPPGRSDGSGRLVHRVPGLATRCTRPRGDRRVHADQSDGDRTRRAIPRDRDAGDGQSVFDTGRRDGRRSELPRRRGARGRRRSRDRFARIPEATLCGRPPGGGPSVTARRSADRDRGRASSGVPLRSRAGRPRSCHWG